MKLVGIKHFHFNNRTIKYMWPQQMNNKWRGNWNSDTERLSFVTFFHFLRFKSVFFSFSFYSKIFKCIKIRLDSMGNLYHSRENIIREPAVVQYWRVKTNCLCFVSPGHYFLNPSITWPLRRQIEPQIKRNIGHFFVISPYHCFKANLHL